MARKKEIDILSNRTGEWILPENVVPLSRYANSSTNYDYSAYHNTEAEKIEEREEAAAMDNNDILMKYMEKVDRDQSDLREDVRESERRMTEKITSVEERMDNRLNRIEDMLKEHKKAIDTKISALEVKIDNLENKFEDVKDKVYESNKQYKWWVIGIFVAIIGVVLASSYAVVQILTSIVTP